MLSRRRSRPSPPATRGQAAVADELVSRLRALLPPGPADAAANNGNSSSSSSLSTAQVLEEACVYIRRLHAEADVVADRLAQLLDQQDHADAAQIIIVRAALLM